MIENDPFGIEREKRILRSGVRKIFTPHQPIQSVNLFFGRSLEVSKLLEYLNTPGQHALLFGDRGVGKSSLANIAAELLLRLITNGNLIKKRCDSSDTFVSVVREVLEYSGIDPNIIEQTKDSGIKLGVNVANVGSRKSVKRSGQFVNANSPSWVAKKIGHIEGLFLIDEVDSLKDFNDKKKLAELVKQLSDDGAKLKILIVGIADSANDLTAGHPSVHRCLKETRLGRMEKSELQQIIIEGQKQVSLTFNPKAIDRIVNVSSGYPHFTHLLALKSAEDAIVNEKRTIEVQDVKKATNQAVLDAEGTLRKFYNDAVRSANTIEYKNIISAAATCNDEEFKAKELRDQYLKLFKKGISQGALNNYLIRLVSDDGSKIIRRLGKGVYRFSDPRMPSFIRIAHTLL